VDFAFFIVVAFDFAFAFGMAVVLALLVRLLVNDFFGLDFFVGEGLDGFEVGEDVALGDEALEVFVVAVVLDEDFFGVPLEIFFFADVTGRGLGATESRTSEGSAVSTSDGSSATGASAASTTSAAASGVFLREHMFPMVASTDKGRDGAERRGDRTRG
jgi:hypothetical protein